MVKYTEKNINQGLKLVEKAKKHQENARKLTLELEISYLRIKNAMIFDFKTYIEINLNNLTEEILKELTNKHPSLYSNPKGKINFRSRIARMRAKKQQQLNLGKIYLYKFDNYESFVWTILKCQKTDREKMIKAGEIKN